RCAAGELSSMTSTLSGEERATSTGTFAVCVAVRFSFIPQVFRADDFVWSLPCIWSRIPKSSAFGQSFRLLARPQIGAARGQENWRLWSRLAITRGRRRRRVHLANASLRTET